jgi:hypothetical protein
MEPLWNRLTGSSKRPKPAEDPSAIRLERTTSATNEILKLLNKAEAEHRQYDLLLSAINDIIKIISFEGSLTSSFGLAAKRDVDLLDSNESISPSKPCTAYFFRNNGLITLGSKIKELPPNIVESIFHLIQVLIDNVCTVDLRVATDQDFILGVMAFLQSMMSFTIIDRNSQSKFCELLFSMASLMKIYRGLLVYWFKVIDKVGGAPSQTSLIPFYDRSKHNTVFHENRYHREFPLFCLLLNYVYHGDKAGEYSRTGLLYLIEVASESPDLVNWVLNSDLGSLMASGLCGLYSQLSRPNTDNKSNTKESNLNTFLSYLLFWQDMLVFARKSSNLTNNLVFHFDVLFVRQLLYPSVVENTDTDGGYSDHLIRLLTGILDTLDHNLLSQSIVCYFIGSPITHTSDKIRIPSVSLFNSKEGQPLLTLEDIIRTVLESNVSYKRTHILHLVSILLSKYYPYFIETLVPIKPIHEKTNLKLNYLNDLSIAQTTCRKITEEIIDPTLAAELLEQYKLDIELKLEQTPFPSPAQRKKLLAEELERVLEIDRILLANYPKGLFTAVQEPKEERCLVLLILEERLKEFFINNNTENLMITLVIIEMGANGWINLHGWITKLLMKQLLQLERDYMELKDIIADFELLLTKIEKGSEEEVPVEEITNRELEGWIPSLSSNASVIVKRSFSLLSYISGQQPPEDGPLALADTGHESSVKPNLYARLQQEKVKFKGETYQILQLCTNALIFREFVCELEALYHIRFWAFV